MDGTVILFILLSAIMLMLLWFVGDAVLRIERTVNAIYEDREPVVRCKDCIWWSRIDQFNGKCPFLIGEHQYASPNHYCSCGERRE